MSRIAIFSNRLPAPEGAKAAVGGLAVALSGVVAETGGTWFGADGADGPEDADCSYHVQESNGLRLASLALSERERAGYYLGFANSVLWPLFHGRTDLMNFERDEYRTYRKVNAKFATAFLPFAGRHDMIWVHDYHLIFLGRELRRRGIELPMGFFLHVPFPPPDTMAALPCHLEIFEGLSAFDLIGFQTRNDARNFRDFVMRFLGGIESDEGWITALGRRFKVGVFPISIDTQRFEALASSAAATRLCAHLKRVFRGRCGIVGVDRLDYTKGLTHRLRAFERLIETLPKTPGRPFLLQIAAPSRTHVPEYMKLREELEAVSGGINARHGEAEWTPVRYISKQLSQLRLAALYRVSQAGLVTPLRDGMNLVAQEYVAAQAPEDPGVLILSRFAGSAECLTGALLVNPYDLDAVAEAVSIALRMPLNERRARWAEMITGLRENDIDTWRSRFIASLAMAGGQRRAESPAAQLDLAAGK